MYKLKFLNTTPNLLTKFYIENIAPFQFLKVLALYDVTT